MKNFCITIIIIISLATIVYAFYKISEKRPADTIQGPVREKVIHSEKITVGETRQVGGVTITLHGVPNDYRCPEDTACIEGGAIVADVTLEDGVIRERRKFPSDEVPYQFAGSAVSITSVEPPVHSGNALAASDYVVTFRVEPMIK